MADSDTNEAAADSNTNACGPSDGGVGPDDNCADVRDQFRVTHTHARTHTHAEAAHEPDYQMRGGSHIAGTRRQTGHRRL
jgi:hypothetical protein